MRALLIPLGSHGDVHPFVGLGKALAARGHDVTLITNPLFADLAARVGLDFAPVGDEAGMRHAIDNPDLWHPTRGFRLVMGMLTQLLRPVHDLIRERYVPGETVVAAQMTAFGARVAHDSLGVPLVTVHLQPSVMLSAVDPPRVPLFSIIKPFPVGARRLLIDWAQRRMVNPLIAPAVDALYAEHGLPPIDLAARWWHSPQRLLGLFPDWFAPPPPDWPSNLTLAGFPLFDEADHTPLDPEVAAFLDSGDPPLVFTAGSANLHAGEFFAASVEACVRLGRRGLLLARLGDQIPRNLPPGVRHFAYVPFSHLLPRAAALVHHGGIGTTAQALAAAIPQLVVPLAHDQPDNAARLERLGVGRSLSPRRATGAAMARELARLLADAAMSTRAAALAACIDPPATLDLACRVIEEAQRSPAPAAVRP
jgi:UDP:flavonoid glycosyltransferase YjiC (YdhE family)